MSTYSDYRSWPALADRAWSARHLRSDPALQERLPKLAPVVDLFRRTETGDRRSPKSTLLFPHFAQWFVDGFLRTDPKDCRKNTSTHDIDLSQLYGQTVEVTKMLRLCSETERGRLKCQRRNGQEFPPYYFDEDGNPNVGFEKLEIVFPGSDDIENLPGEDRKTGVPFEEFEDWQRKKLFALGIPRGNIHYGLMMMSTLFLREHNRIAGLIAEENPEWNDDRVFEATRNTLTVILLKVVIEDYINHITPVRFKFFAEPGYRRQREVVPTKLDVGRVQPAVPLAHHDSQPGASGRSNAEHQRRDVGHRRGDQRPDWPPCSMRLPSSVATPSVCSTPIHV